MKTKTFYSGYISYYYLSGWCMIEDPHFHLVSVPEARKVFSCHWLLHRQAAATQTADASHVELLGYDSGNVAHPIHRRVTAWPQPPTAQNRHAGGVMECAGGRAWGRGGASGDDFGPWQASFIDDLQWGPSHCASDRLQLTYRWGVDDTRLLLDSVHHSCRGRSQRSTGGGGRGMSHTQQLPIGLVDQQPLPTSSSLQQLRRLTEVGQQHLTVSWCCHWSQRLPIASHIDLFRCSPTTVGSLCRDYDVLQGLRGDHPSLRGHNDALGLRRAATISNTWDGDDAPHRTWCACTNHSLHNPLAIWCLSPSNGCSAAARPRQQRAALNLWNSNDLGSDRCPWAMGVGALNNSDRWVAWGALGNHHLPDARVDCSDVYDMRSCRKSRRRLGQWRLTKHNLQQANAMRQLTLHYKGFFSSSFF